MSAEVAPPSRIEATHHESVLVYRSFRYLKLAALTCLLAALAYAIHDPQPMPNGGTWLGYILGTLSLAIILFLAWFGIRKRQYGPSSSRLADWLSAHVYLGLSLIVLATLHTGFQLGWNVHTLAYGLMLLVILSGAFGVYTYIRYPQLMTENRRGMGLLQLMGQIAQLDREMRRLGLPLSEAVNKALLSAANETRIGGNFWQQLRGYDPHCATTRARLLMTHLAEHEAGNSAAMRQLLGLLTRKEALLGRARRDVQLAALLKAWLFVHVPLTFALLAALFAHVFSVFFYW
ncbi:hypothetical protein [Ferrovibrio sp.]|uniref:hypothetical protein n=1 Tax=Ferrovibrio sp. TaxID=1917215 RepID=UPI001B55ACD6|nr:hypothetical protein [Ferrovibrio sp.]MBP7064749.1 hypothetical protein [Ferrovibrio sp.]